MWTAMSWASSWDAPIVLYVEVRVDQVAGSGLEADYLSQLDVLLDGNIEVFDGRLPLVHGLLALARHQRGQLVDQVDEIRALGTEIRLRPQLHHRDRVGHAVVGDGHRSLLTAPVGAFGRFAQTAFPQPRHGRLRIPIGLCQGALRIHHPGPRGDSQGLHVLGGELCHILRS
jgi:hypothetical protein